MEDEFAINNKHADNCDCPDCTNKGDN